MCRLLKLIEVHGDDKWICDTVDVRRALEERQMIWEAEVVWSAPFSFNADGGGAVAELYSSMPTTSHSMEEV
jgi:hypothetical protein